MPRINVPGAGHAGPPAIGRFQWLPFTDPVHQGRLEHAMAIIDARIKGYAPCNASFAALPGGRSFAQVWADQNIWISYDPRDAFGKFAGTVGNDVAVTQYACRMGVWTIVATLIHELAHVNGADALGHAAEQTLTSCLMQPHHDPAINGMLRDRRAMPPAMAVTPRPLRTGRA